MLVLTRKVGETITIDGDITIQIVSIKGKQIRVGIEAPKSKKVQRGELIEKFNNFSQDQKFNIKEPVQPNSPL